MLRFVILRHELDAATAEAQGATSLARRGDHFDLMLEADGELLTWAMSKWPLEFGESTDAISLPPHRLAYLDYEGVVSRGRGTVKRVTSGFYVWEDQSDPGLLVIALQTDFGTYRLRIASDRITALTIPSSEYPLPSK